MKNKVALIALLACAFMQSAFAAEYGVEMALLNDNPTPAIGDRLAFQEVGNQQCRYYGIVKSAEVAVINRKTCPDGLTTTISMIVPLDKVKASESGLKRYKAYEQGPAPLAVSFMTQFYDVPAEAVEVKIIEQSPLEAKVATKAAGHICMFEAAKLPEGSYALHGWAASSMNCGK